MRRRRRDGDDHVQQRLPLDAVRRRYHITGTQTGKFSFDPTDPALPNSTGSFTIWFGEHGNSRTFNAMSTFSVRGRTDDGEHVRFNVTTHITVVDSDVIVEFEKVSCP